MKKTYKTPACHYVSIATTPLLVNSPENIDVENTPQNNVVGDARERSFWPWDDSDSNDNMFNW